MFYTVDLVVAISDRRQREDVFWRSEYRLGGPRAAAMETIKNPTRDSAGRRHLVHIFIPAYCSTSYSRNSNNIIITVYNCRTPDPITVLRFRVRAEQ